VFTFDKADSAVLHRIKEKLFDIIFAILRRFPKQYPSNSECTWEIFGENGYHIGLVFVDRFSLEDSPNCEKDYVEV